MTADTNTELLIDRIDVCNDATLERLETIIELLQEIRNLLKQENETINTNDTNKTI